MKISDKELNVWGRSLVGRGLREAIVGLRHCNFNDPSYEELRVIEHYSKVIEYLYNLGKYRICCTRRISEYNKRKKLRDKMISKLRGREVGTEWGSIPVNFFDESNG